MLRNGASALVKAAAGEQVSVFGMEPFWTPSRTISAGIVALYVSFSAMDFGVAAGVRMVAFCIVPVVCIWFPDVMGKYKGFLIGFPVGITSDSPPSLVFLLGWFLLLLPVLLVLLVYLFR